MPYTPRVWKDGQNKYDITDQLGNVIQSDVKLIYKGTEGTPVSAANMNQIEQALAVMPDKATQVEAEAGIDDTKYMTSLKVKHAVTKLDNNVDGLMYDVEKLYETLFAQSLVNSTYLDNAETLAINTTIQTNNETSTAMGDIRPNSVVPLTGTWNGTPSSLYDGDTTTTGGTYYNPGGVLGSFKIVFPTPINFSTLVTWRYGARSPTLTYKAYDSNNVQVGTTQNDTITSQSIHQNNISFGSVRNVKYIVIEHTGGSSGYTDWWVRFTEIYATGVTSYAIQEFENVVFNKTFDFDIKELTFLMTKKAPTGYTIGDVIPYISINGGTVWLPMIKKENHAYVYDTSYTEDVYTYKITQSGIKNIRIKQVWNTFGATTRTTAGKKVLMTATREE
ncbi:MAG TPA: hypothetical protein DCP90_01955 [Clostridiales bacterium]|nr:MAG: hypothetical protein A2Y22_08705 [Clostridiales bacterium GWD2_32_59]HAN09357.1 hypothetical protein [Clostridiales bacterium]